ncbi:hypothetical protein LRS74_21350 [Streptomyces sp. LX-29]|uniref:hypothetical protein n=1 Tax=Streptomyces sp. LX-29 TaxID=2900152 RepID=UPI00240E1BB5|nr:hypothetical protein [Streptomyces sp. LX-29]WFB09300.1 hypothetical protein LRS74_21350 [Streptomyces sp. LX-29]
MLPLRRGATARVPGVPTLLLPPLLALALLVLGLGLVSPTALATTSPSAGRPALAATAAPTGPATAAATSPADPSGTALAAAVRAGTADRALAPRAPAQCENGEHPASDGASATLSGPRHLDPLSHPGTGHGAGPAHRTPRAVPPRAPPLPPTGCAELLPVLRL